MNRFYLVYILSAPFYAGRVDRVGSQTDVSSDEMQNSGRRRKRREMNAPPPQRKPAPDHVTPPKQSEERRAAGERSTQTRSYVPMYRDTL